MSRNSLGNCRRRDHIWTKATDQHKSYFNSSWFYEFTKQSLHLA